MKMKGGDPMENKEYEYDRYEVKLSRFMNIQKDFGLFLKMLIGYILMAAINIFAGNEGFSFLILLTCIYIFVVFLILFRNPGRLEITRTTVGFSYLNIEFGSRHRVYNLDNPPPKMKETFVVHNIKSIEYLQTPFEKIFSCGHICMIGDIYLEFGKKEERMFMIYGVKHFDDISAWMKDFMILSADEQF
jgi:hypothetical protein